MMTQVRLRLVNAKNDLMLWGWRSPGRGVLLTIGLGCLTTLLIFLGHVVGSWVGGWIGELGAALGMLVGAWGGLVIGTLIAEAVGVSFRHRCSL
ncbi:MAG: hypothetical protein ACE5G5_02690 [Candidatus Methylomirabilales bacterium]